MFERRPIWVLILGLNVCVLIWRISVQEPAMIEEEMLMTGAGGVAIGSGNTPILQQQQQLYAGKHLLADDQITTALAAGNAAHNEVHSKAEITPRKTYKYEYTTSLKEQEYLRKLNNNSESRSNDSSSSSNTNKTNSSDSISSQVISNLAKVINKNNMNNKTSAISNMQNPMTDYAVTPAPSVTVSTALKRRQQQRQQLRPPRDQRVPHNNATSAVAATHSVSLAVSNIMAAVRALPASDRAQLIDLHNFSYSMVQPSCAANVAALILVHSAPRNFEKRALIRETWGSLAHAAHHVLRVLFLLGAVDDGALQWQLQQENAQHNDMIQGTFIDDYRNMTYKHVMALKWFLYNCAHAQILIKVDDDVFVNTPQLLKYMQGNHSTNVTTEAAAAGTTSLINTTTNTNNATVASAAPAATAAAAITSTKSQFNAAQTLFQHPTNLLFCQEYIGSLVKRSYRSKWRVSFREYAGRYYPPYCPGYAIIYSNDVVLRLYRAAQKAHYFWIDDVHITGVLAQSCNINITTLMPYVLFSDKCERLLAGKTDLSHEEFLFAWHRISPTQIRAVWHLHLNNDNNSFSSPSSTVAASTSTASALTVAPIVSELNDNYSNSNYVSNESYEHFS